MEPVEPIQVNIYQTNTYRKDLGWLHFKKWAKGSGEATREGPTILHICFCSLSNIFK